MHLCEKIIFLHFFKSLSLSLSKRRVKILRKWKQFVMIAITFNTIKTGFDIPETWNAWTSMTKFQTNNEEIQNTDKVTDSKRLAAMVVLCRYDLHKNGAYFLEHPKSENILMVFIPMWLDKSILMYVLYPRQQFIVFRNAIFFFCWPILHCTPQTDRFML